MIDKLQKLMASILFEAGSNIACGKNMPYDQLGFRRVTDRLHIGNRWMAQSGFNTYDNTARMHYPLLPSFDAPDPLSQDYPSLSPYSHCAGNPLSLIDPTGMDIYRFDENSQDFILYEKNDDNFDAVGKFKYDKETDSYILKTDKKGNAKIKVENIAKGILYDGVNFSDRDQLIQVGQKGEPTVADVYDFLIELAENFWTWSIRKRQIC